MVRSMLQELPAGGTFPSTSQPGRAQSRLAIVLIGGLGIAFAASVPFAKQQLPAIVAFIAVYQSVLVACDLLTAALILGQHKLLRSPALLVLACGYVFTALVSLVHMLTFPGLFAPDGLFDPGPQTTAWLYMYWHAGFPASVIAYVFLKEKPGLATVRDVRLAIGSTAAVALGGAAALICLSAPGRELLPPIMQGHQYSSAMLGVVSAVWGLSIAAAFVAWRSRPRSVLDLWLIVVMCAWTFDIALSAVLNNGRFDLGFYAGRVFGLVAAVVVLLVFLAEYARLNERLARALDGEVHRRREAQGQAENESRELGIVRHQAETAAREARQRLEGIIDSAMDAIITVDDRHDIVLFNRAAELIFGYSAAEVLGKPLARLLPERFREAHSSDLQRFGQTEAKPRRMSAQRVVSGLRRDGEEFPVEASISHATLEGHRYFTVVLRDITERVRADEALRQSKTALMEMAALSSMAQEHEKRRVSRELHDEIGQILAAMKLDIEWLAEHVDPGNPAKTARVASIRSLTNDAVTSIRRIAADLRPAMLDDLGLVPAMQWLTTTFEKRYGIACRLLIEPPDFELADPQATTLFRIAQESLSNVARHAHASRVEVHLVHRGDEVRLAVSDDGRGFDPAGPRREDAFGMLGLRERAYLVNGTLSVDSAPGRGTRIEAVIPVARKPSPAN